MGTNKEISNPAILESIKRGDRSVFDAVFREYYSYLCNYAYQFTKEKEASEEIVQEVFFILWEKKESIDIKTSLKSYLFKAVHNHSLNLIQKIKTRDKYKEFNKTRINLDETQLACYAEERELMMLIEESIEELPPERKKIFTLSRNDGLKNKEIAEKLNISIKTVEGQMGKALKYLRGQLSDYLPIAIYGIIYFTIKFYIE